MARLCLPALMFYAVGCSALGGGHWNLGEDRTAHVLTTMSVGGAVMSLTALFEATSTNPPYEETPEWTEPVFWTGLGLLGASILYDTIHAPMVARRNSERARLHIGPDRVMLVCKF